MKKQFIFLSIWATLLLCGCENDGLNSQQAPTAMFTFQTQQPLMAIFNNTSINASSYSWDFGDGKNSTEKSPTHKYNDMGVYRVVLTVANRAGKTATYSRNITVERPTKCYFAGITYKQLSVNNKYVYFKVTDDDFFTTTWCTSSSKLLSTANLPYLLTFSTPVYMNGLSEDDYYDITLYYSSTPSGSGTKLHAFRFQTSDLNNYPTGLLWPAVGGNQIQCHFIWR